MLFLSYLCQGGPTYKLTYQKVCCVYEKESDIDAKFDYVANTAFGYTVAALNLLSSHHFLPFPHLAAAKKFVFHESRCKEVASPP
jgi:hypothetical protein